MKGRLTDEASLRSMRVGDGVVTTEPFASRTACANGHPWTMESTRWRIRYDKGETFATRDCLICKRVSEGLRRRSRR